MAFIDKRAIWRAKLIVALIAVGGIMSFASFVWLWLFPPSNMSLLIIIAALGTITAIASIILVVVYLVLLIMTAYTGKPYIAFPTLTVVRKVLSVKDEFLLKLSPQVREKVNKLLNEWEKTLEKGGEDI